MPSHRKSRHERLFRSDAEKIIEEALTLRDTILRIDFKLSTTSPQYAALRDLTESLHASLATIAGKEPNSRFRGLDLLPLPEDYDTKK